MKRINSAPQTEALIETLEESLSNTYGSRFIIDLQEICGQHTLKSIFGEGVSTKVGRDEYKNMLRGAWYATLEKKVVK